ncbi:MAG: hypothetical protein K2I51_05450 [Muribaculaceae bacterium]|nr:hypothetical protein [Muribaculaceae bacterium]
MFESSASKYAVAPVASVTPKVACMPRGRGSALRSESNSSTVRHTSRALRITTPSRSRHEGELGVRLYVAVFITAKPAVFIPTHTSERLSSPPLKRPMNAIVESVASTLSMKFDEAPVSRCFHSRVRPDRVDTPGTTAEVHAATVTVASNIDIVNVTSRFIIANLMLFSVFFCILRKKS